MSVGKVNEFNIKNGTWSSYVDRLEMYFVVNEIEAGKKLPTLISVIGDEAYELLTNLSSPKKPSELKYEEAIELLTQHLQPSPSALAERYRFKQRRQAMDENIATFVAELKRLTRYCKFNTTLNENLRDQFVCGLRSEVIRQRLFAEKDTITFSDAIKLAMSLEAAERDAAVMERDAAVEMHAMYDAPSSNENGGNGAEQDLHTMTHGGDGGPSMGPWRSRGRAVSGPWRGGPERFRGNAAAAAPFQRRSYYCGGCGATDHNYTVCRFRSYVCSRCRRTGHLRRVCPEADNSRPRGGASSGRGGASRSRASASRTGLYHGDVSDDTSAVEDNVEEDFHHLCLNNYQAV